MLVASLQKAVEKAGLANVRFHDLRHGAATALLAAKYDERLNILLSIFIKLCISCKSTLHNLKRLIRMLNITCAIRYFEATIFLRIIKKQSVCIQTLI